MLPTTMAYDEVEPDVKVQCPKCPWIGLPRSMARFMVAPRLDSGERFCPRCMAQIRPTPNTRAAHEVK